MNLQNLLINKDIIKPDDLQLIISDIQNKNRDISINTEFESYTNLLKFRLRFLDKCMYFSVNKGSIDYLYLQPLIQNYIDKFKQSVFDMSHKPTKELILEYYFNSYIYSKQTDHRSTVSYVYNNPNICLGRRQGHTKALIDFIKEPSYYDIVKNTCFVFHSNHEKREVIQELTFKELNPIINNFILAEHYRFRGRTDFSFIIFNSKELSVRFIHNYPDILHNKHFIILGN